jgi:hypothetical protein
MRVAVVFLSLFLSFPAARAGTIRVPLDRPTIQEAIVAAEADDVVLVDPGDYPLVGSIDFLGKPVTVRSRDGAGATVIRQEGAGSVVVFRSGEAASSVLDGFTITAGTGTVVGGIPYGGGLHCSGGSSPTLRNLVVVRNRAIYGGALYCKGSSPTVTNCKLSQNRVTCGGGAFLDASSPTFIGCEIRGNRGSYASSGIHSKNGSRATIVACRIIGNMTYYGGGVDGFGASPTLISCVLAGNRANLGSAAYFQNASPVFRYCSVEGAIEQASSTLQLSACILTGGSTVGLDNSSCLIGVNPLFVDAGAFDYDRFVRVGIAGTEEEMPDFVVEEPDYHLRPGSPAIDAGPAYGPETDLDGRSRPQGAGFDIGAYERGAGAGQFRRGDVNGDGRTDLSDPFKILLFAFRLEPLPCERSADVNADLEIDLSDPIHLLSYLFLDGPPPRAPFPECGSASVADGPTCASFPDCR